jgi:hypothetical protein
MGDEQREMNEEKPTQRQGIIARYLEPVDRLAEIIYGVLIVMTFTLTYRGIDANMLPANIDASDLVRRLFLAAFGCVIAWGLIDAFMYVLLSVFGRAEQQRVVRTIHAATDEAAGIIAVSDALDDELLEALNDEERAHLHHALVQRYQAMPLPRVGVTRDDLYGALAIFALAVVATLPVALPFLLTSDPLLAMRLSNLVAIILLFVVGYRWASYLQTNPWKFGAFLALFGVIIVLIAIPLGG